MTVLRVDLYGQAIGYLNGAGQTFDFRATPEAIERWGLGSPALSFAIPLTLSPRPTELAGRRNYFAEELAEGPALKRLAEKARLDETNTMGLLARYGRDVAGALRIWDEAAPGEPRTPEYLPLTPQEIRSRIENVRLDPLGNTNARHMSSLAGIQPKLVLAQQNGAWGEAVDGYPTTHIVKPVNGILPTLIFDEEYGSRIVRDLGLARFDSHLETFDGVTALVIQRYDRSPTAPDLRIHQEDFNQALGRSGDAKYEENGHPGLAAIARIVLNNVGTEATERLLRLTAASVAMGNLDMHAKNLSILHLPDGSLDLAPAYDVVPQMHMGFDPRFAFNVNGVGDHELITLADLAAEGRKWGLRRSETLVQQTVEQVAAFVEGEAPAAGAHYALADDIARFCSNLLQGRGASASISRTRRSESPRYAPQAPGGWGGPVRG